jgi:hypothetical protein
MLALYKLNAKVVMAKAANPSGAGSATNCATGDRTSDPSSGSPISCDETVM